MKIGLDTNVLIAAWAGWHEHHRTTHTAIAAARRQGHACVVASHALKECYAVLTRLPQPWRFSPEQASRLLAANVERMDLLEATCSAGAQEIIQRAAERHIGGGRVYDFDMFETLLGAGIACFWTFNVRHFQPWAPGNIAVCAPDASGFNC